MTASNLRVLLATTLISLAPGKLFAFCSEPSFWGDAPSLSWSTSRPTVPFCLQEYAYSGSHSCDSWEVDAYINDVNNYIRELNDYVSEARNFANDAIDFANQAADYAECEAQEVSNQHQ